jgi:hypothetical protein
MATTENDAAEAGKGHEKKLHVEVFAPKDPEKTKKFAWEPTLTVAAAAVEAAEKFHYSAEGTPGLTKAGKVLQGPESLAQAGVSGGDVLGLIDVGGGV